MIVGGFLFIARNRLGSRIILLIAPTLIIVTIFLMFLLSNIFDFLKDRSIILKRDENASLLLLTSNFKLHENLPCCDSSFLLGLENLSLGSGSSLLDNSAYLRKEIPSLLWGLWASTKFIVWWVSFLMMYTVLLRNGVLIGRDF